MSSHLPSVYVLHNIISSTSLDMRFIYLFLDQKCPPEASIEWYYQYQNLYFQLLAEKKLAATSKSSSASDEGSCAVQQRRPQRSSGTGCVFLTDKEIADMSQSTDQNQFNISDINFVTNNMQATGYSCQRCGNAYARPHSLNRHIRFECGVEPQFECPICHKKSKHKHNLALHMRTHQKP